MIAAARSMHFSNAFDSHFEYSSKQRSLRQLFSSNPVGGEGWQPTNLAQTFG